MRHCSLALVLAAALTAPQPSGAQPLRTWPSARPFQAPTAAFQGSERPPVVRPVLGGVLAGGLGFFAGVYAGAALSQGGLGSFPGCDSEDVGCLLDAILVGAAVGEAALMPVGVHLGGGRRGPLGLELLASASIAAVGVAVTEATGEPAFLIPVPVLQLLVLTAIERR